MWHQVGWPRKEFLMCAHTTGLEMKHRHPSGRRIIPFWESVLSVEKHPAVFSCSPPWVCLVFQIVTYSTEYVKGCVLREPVAKPLTPMCFKITLWKKTNQVSIFGRWLLGRYGLLTIHRLDHHLLNPKRPMQIHILSRPVEVEGGWHPKKGLNNADRYPSSFTSCCILLVPIDESLFGTDITHGFHAALLFACFQAFYYIIFYKCSNTPVGMSRTCPLRAILQYR